MQITDLALEGVKLVVPRKFGDARGFFSETWSARVFADAGLDLTFVQDNQSRSGPVGTVRGLHYQAPPHAQAKLVRVTRGRILDVAVDLRKASPTYGRHVAVELSAENWAQLLVPVGFAHGFMTLEPDTEVIYKVTSFYAPEVDFGLRWDDPALAINWPLTAKDVVLSAKDQVQPLLADIVSPF